MRYYYQGRWWAYDPIQPQEDSAELAEKGARLVFFHNLEEGPIVQWANVHEVSRGWAIGIVRYT